MSMQAEIFVIGPKKVIVPIGLADYVDSYYNDVPDDAIILGSVFVAESTEQSREIANVCGVGVWDLGNHAVTHPKDAYPDDAVYHKLYVLLASLNEHRNVQIWFRPNG